MRFYLLSIYMKSYSLTVELTTTRSTSFPVVSLYYAEQRDLHL